MTSTRQRAVSGRRIDLESAFTAVAYVLLTGWALVGLFPLYWMFKNSFEPNQLLNVWPPKLLPRWGQLTFANYATIWRRFPIDRWFLNSGIVSTTRTAGAVLFGAAAGYSFAKLRYFGREVLFWMLMSVMMIPGFVLIIPRYQIVHKLGWIDTYAGLIIPGISGGMGAMFLMRQFMRTLPSELMDSARIDGANEFMVFWRVILPLAKPGMAVLAIFQFIGNWNTFNWPLIVTRDKMMRTLPVGLALLSGTGMGQPQIGEVLAGASIAAVPMIIIFFFFQRYFLRGITIGALKG